LGSPISEDLLSQVNQKLTAEMGLYFPKERWGDLARGIAAAASEFDFQNIESFFRWLVVSELTRNQIKTLASHLTVGETYFFRESKSLEILEEHILPELIRSRRGIDQRLRIWSAGCCTGEEPYTIAILLDRLLPDIKDWQVTITATDINPSFLKKASDGVYSEWSFRETPSRIKERYFKNRKRDQFEVFPNIKRMVTFSYLNLAEDAHPSPLSNTGAMDVILCRNVLMYFGANQVNRAIQNFYKSLVEGGWLAVSPSEISSTLFSQFVSVSFPGAYLYKKDSARRRKVEAHPYEAGEASDSLQLPLNGFAPSAPAVPLSKASEITVPSETATEQPQSTPYLEALALYEQARYRDVVDQLLAWLSRHQAGSSGEGPSAKAIALLARAYANQGLLVEALEWCGKAIAADKLDPGCHYLSATILQEQGQVEEAIKALKRALYLDHEFVPAHFALANLWLHKKNFVESGKHFRNALSLLRNYPQEAILPGSEGITAGKLAEIISSMAEGTKSV